MKKLILLHISAFIGIFVLMITLYIIDLTIGISIRAPMPIEIGLDVMRVVFLTTAMLLWFWAWYILVKQWNAQSTEQNLIGLAALLIGNIFGAYFVLYVYKRDCKNREVLRN